MTEPKPIDLDAELAADEELKAEAPNTQPIVLFGRTWDVLTDINSFSLAQLQSGDWGAIPRHLRNTVIPEQRDDFANAFADAPNMTEARLGKIIQKILEVQAGRPTTKPSRSSRPASKRTSSPKSAAR